VFSTERKKERKKERKEGGKEGRKEGRKEGKKESLSLCKVTEILSYFPLEKMVE
jgi:flagellar biosynthesis/type III secretory pathway protein FliH